MCQQKRSYIFQCSPKIEGRRCVEDNNKPLHTKKGWLLRPYNHSHDYNIIISHEKSLRQLQKFLYKKGRGPMQTPSFYLFLIMINLRLLHLLHHLRLHLHHLRLRHPRHLHLPQAQPLWQLFLWQVS